MEIIFDNVTYRENLGTPLKKTYLDNISFKIEENKITTFIGDSESGKTKIGELINATVSPTYGTVQIFGFLNNRRRIKNVNKLRMNVGFVTMNPSDMLFNKTVKKELEFGVNYFKYKLNKKEIRSKDALKLVGLKEEYLNKKIEELTLTEQKKVALASVLIFNPKVIIFDEPTIGLGTPEKESLKKLILLLKEKYDKTIILLTKDTDFAYQVTDTTHLLYKGSIVASGDKSVMTNEKMMEGYGLKLPEIVKFITRANESGKNLTLTDNILDLIKEVYRNAK